MMGKILIITLPLAFMGFCGFFATAGNCFDEGQASQFYESCIVKELEKCRAKDRLHHSKSKNLREYAEVKTCKAAFLTDQKDALIQEMLKNRIALRPHRVAAYLNHRFCEMNPPRATDQEVYHAQQ